MSDVITDAGRVPVLEAEIARLRDEHAAALALVADVRFACGDYGQRMQPELLEYLRELAADAARYRHLRENRASISYVRRPGELDEHVEISSVVWARRGSLDAAVDAVMAAAKGGA